MVTKSQQIVVADITVEVVRKRIKNLHLGVYPPHGRVRVAAPFLVSDEAVRLAVIGKLGWIKRHQAKFAAQERQSPREYLTGESHYYRGRRYRLNVLVESGREGVTLRNATTLDLRVKDGSDPARRAYLLQEWYRRRLKEEIPPLLAKWEPIVGVQAAAWGVKQMKTRWGTCNPKARRIWLNLELIKKSPVCLEYVLVHELVHLLERHHNERFTAFMDRFLPNWSHCRDELRQAPLRHEEWEY